VARAYAVTRNMQPTVTQLRSCTVLDTR
jgi:hypothetical protein